jgi:hypothetical protein
VSSETEATETAVVIPNLPVQRAENGVLVFKNTTDYFKTCDALNLLGVRALFAFNNKYGFVSQKQRFNTVVDAEYAVFMNPNLTKNDPRPEHSEAYKKAFEDGILKIEPLEGWADRYTFTVHPFYAATINEKGFVVIGNDLVQFTPTSYKVMRGGTTTDCEFLNEIKATGANVLVYQRKKNVGFLVIQDVEVSPSKGITADVVIDQSQCLTGSDTYSSGNQSMYVWTGMESQFLDRRNNLNQITGYYRYRHNGFVYAQHTCKDWLGKSQYQNRDTYISTSWKFKSPWNTVFTSNFYTGGTGIAQDQAVVLSSFNPQSGGNLNSGASQADITDYFNGNQWLYNANTDITPTLMGLTGNTFPYPKALRPTTNSNGIASVTNTKVKWRFAATGFNGGENYFLEVSSCH